MIPRRSKTVELTGSGREAPAEAALVGEIDPDAPLAVALYFRRRTPAPPPGSAADFRRLTPTTREALARERMRTHTRAAARVAAFARAHGLAVRETDLTGRRMVLEAPAQRLVDIFGATVRLYSEGEQTYRARTGTLQIPQEIAPWTRAVVGFDQRPLLRRAAGDAASGLWPTEVATLYGIPLDRDVSQQCVGIIAMGGGFQRSDVTDALTRMGRAPPDIVERSVGGVSNQYGGGTEADQEIALDMQVLAGLLPRARILIYFADNKAEALADAISQALKDEYKPTVLSISWGSPEFYWTEPRRDVVCAALRDAVRLRVSVVVAAGDQLATSGMTDGKAHVWFPASSPYVLGCGGTSMTLAGSVIGTETVWNEPANAIGTGGGISDNYPVPDFQLTTALPPSFNDGRNGRGVPDVAALAAKSPGYRIVVGGSEMAKDGTSAATPLWAALIAMINAGRSTPIGLINPHLYAAPALMRPITTGDNKQNNIGYTARSGWSACTGLGVPRGAEIITALAAIPMA